MKKIGTTILAALTGGLAGASAVSQIWRRKCAISDDREKKFLEFYNILNEWLIIKQTGRSFVEYFEKNQYKTVAIYGMKELGQRLYDELKDSNIKVAYAIDQKADKIYAEVDIVTPDDDLPKVDVIVVTAIHYFDEIEENLSGKVDYPVISLEDIVYEL